MRAKKNKKKASKKGTKKTTPKKVEKLNPRRVPSMRVSFTEGSELEALSIIEKCHTAKDSSVMAAISFLKGSITKLKERADIAACAAKPAYYVPQASSSSKGASYFDSLGLIRHVLTLQDLLFLSRQVTYHIAADAELPQVFADSEQIRFVFSQLVEHLVRRSVRGSRISIAFKPISLRSGPGVEMIFSNIDRETEGSSGEDFVAGLFQGKTDDVSGVALSSLRLAATKQRGQLWVECTKPFKPSYHLVMPASEQTAIVEQASQQTFKYDISINNYSDLRKKFGSRKSLSLVTQIEHYIRSLVRYPIDMVLALGEKGVITTIYETQRGTAQSVASRISARLGSEKFKIGKKSVDLAFSYHLSPITTSVSSSPQAGTERNN